jgi:hypothetical protein
VPPLRGLRRAWPDRRIVLAAPVAVGEWLARLGIVDAVLPTEGLSPGWSRGQCRIGSGHLAVNLHGQGPESHRLLLATGPGGLVAFDCPGVGHPGPPWSHAEHEVDRWCRLVNAAGGDCGRDDLRLQSPPDAGNGDAVVLLHPGAASGARRWPAARWAVLAQFLVDEGHTVVLTGSAAEEGLCAAVADAVPRVSSMAGLLDLGGLASLVAGARLLVCGDTGVAHLATAYGTPSVLLFGPTPPDRWGPAVDLDRHTVIWHGEGEGDPHAEQVDAALASITVEEVRVAATGLLERDLATFRAGRSDRG